MPEGYRFKRLVPLLKDTDIMYSLYGFSNPQTLETFLKNKRIDLSIEEIETLWDIIEVCRTPRVQNNLVDLENKQTDSKIKLKDEELNASGGFDEFCNRITNIINILEENIKEK